MAVTLTNSELSEFVDKISAQKAAIDQLTAALQKAVNDYGKPGGPWNVPNEPGQWLYEAKQALAAAEKLQDNG